MSKQSIGNKLKRNLMRRQAEFNEKTVGQNRYKYQFPKGYIRVDFWIGKCKSGGLGNDYTGWLSITRIVIEEVPPPQA